MGQNKLWSILILAWSFDRGEVAVLALIVTLPSRLQSRLEVNCGSIYFENGNRQLDVASSCKNYIEISMSKFIQL